MVTSTAAPSHRMRRRWATLRLGVRPAGRGWYRSRRCCVTTLAPDALMYDRCATREYEMQRDVAIALLRFSPQITVGEEETIVVNVNASLRLFGESLSYAGK